MATKKKKLYIWKTKYQIIGSTNWRIQDAFKPNWSSEAQRLRSIYVKSYWVCLKSFKRVTAKSLFVILNQYIFVITDNPSEK